MDPRTTTLAANDSVVMKTTFHQSNTHPHETMNNLASDTLMFGAVGLTAIYAQISPDVATLCGSMVAGLLALNHARKSDMDGWSLGSVVLASISIGATVPNGILFTWYPETAAKLTFHVWGLLGIIFGLLGWALVAVVFSLSDFIMKRKERIAERLARRAGYDDGPDPTPPPRVK